MRASSRGTCIDLGEAGPPFGPMVEMLRALVREDGAGAIRAHAGPAAAELGRLVPELAAPERRARPGDPPGGATRLFEVVLGLFERLAVDGPVLLLDRGPALGRPLDRATCSPTSSINSAPPGSRS